MTRHVFFISCALILFLQCPWSSAYGQDPERQEGPWRRDPFRYGVLTSQQSELLDQPSMQKGLNVKGILRGRDGRYLALTNYRQVKAGESVENVHVLSVSRFSVVVEDMDGSRKIDLFNNQVKWGEQ